MTNFITDNTALPAVKSDLRTLPIGANPNQYNSAADFNALRQALLDVRTYLQAGSPMFDKVITISIATGGSFTDLDNVNFGTLGQNTLVHATFDAGSVHITGFVGGTEGKILVLHSITNSEFIDQDDNTSAVGNRISLNAASIGIGADAFMWFRYNGGTAHWEQIGGSTATAVT